MGEAREMAAPLDSPAARAQYPHVSPVTEGVLKGLWERGAKIDLIVPEECSWNLSELRPAHDLYVLKSETPLALSLAGALTVAGGEGVNAFRAANLARDKIAARAVLAGSGVPVPSSYATGNAALLLPLLDEGPLWVKPQRGTKGAGIQRLASSKELDPHRECRDAFGLPLPFFAQKELATSGKDLKVYVVGEEAWAIERRFPAVTESEKAGSPVELLRKIREAALLCGQVLGLELYGVDFLVATGGGFAAIDVNAFPGYKGVAAAPAALAAYIHRRALAAHIFSRLK